MLDIDMAEYSAGQTFLIKFTETMVYNPWDQRREVPLMPIEPFLRERFGQQTTPAQALTAVREASMLPLNVFVATYVGQRGNKIKLRPLQGLGTINPREGEYFLVPKECIEKITPVLTLEALVTSPL